MEVPVQKQPSTSTEVLVCMEQFADANYKTLLVVLDVLLRTTVHGVWM